ncbi:MAG: hypothetical protein ACLFPQ_04065 [Candidatus Woesearchaeota archaeon]
MKRKAQVTIFILIGLAILVIAGAGILVANFSKDALVNPDGEGEIITERVASEFTPVQSYVDSCLETVGEEAVRKLGQQGGYVYSDLLSADSYAPTERPSDSLVFFPGDDSYKIAYWHYMDSSNSCDDSGSCSFSSMRPELIGTYETSIEAQLEKYVSENIEDCLADFVSMKQAGFDFEINDEPSADVTIASDDVVVQLEYPINVKKSNLEEDMQHFFVRLPVNLKGIYEFSRTLAEGEKHAKYLERQSLNLVSIFSGTTDDSVLPPMSDMTVLSSEEEQIWTQTAVKRRIQDILTSYVPFTQVIGTRNFEEIEVENEIAERMFKMMNIYIPDAEDNSLSSFEVGDYSVDFDYKSWWDPYVKLGNSEILRPSGILPSNDFPMLSSLTSKLGVKQYKFAYDMSYPVLVKIFDHNAFNGDGYSFYIALESNVRNNFPVNGSENTLTGSVVSSMLCNNNQKVSGDITFNVMKEDGSYASGVDVSYECGSYSCHLGTTENGPFTTKFPLCVGGRVAFKSSEYADRYYNLSISEGDTYDLDVSLQHYRTKNVDFRVHMFRKTGDVWSFDEDARELVPTEVVVLSFERQGENFDDSLNFAVVARGDDPEPATVELVPGRYNVYGTLMLEFPAAAVPGVMPALDRVYIEGKTMSVPSGFLGLGREEVELEPIEFEDAFPEGGVYLDDEHAGAWEVSATELDNYDTIIFKLIASPGAPLDSLEHEDLEEMGKIEYYSVQYGYPWLRPTYE